MTDVVTARLSCMHLHLCGCLRMPRKVMQLLSLYERSYHDTVSHYRKGQNCIKLERLPGSKSHNKTRFDNSVKLGFGNFILPISVLNPTPNKQDS